MNGDYFLDTNVFVYSFDAANLGKAWRARELIERALVEGGGCTSWQVVQEFLNVALHKWQKPLSPPRARTYVQDVLTPLCRVMPGARLWETALRLHQSTQFRWYDSLIVAAALEAGVGTLFTEDHQDGRRIDGMTISNPFL